MTISTGAASWLYSSLSRTVKRAHVMSALPAKVTARLAEGIKRFQPILASAKSRDVGEADTSVIVTEMLSDVFGYDKFLEITSEHEIKSTYCDKAIKVEGKLVLLVEIKPIGSDMKDSYIRQATDYAAKQGVDWVVLTNGVVWRTYKMLFTKPVEFEMVVEFNFCELNPKHEKDLELLSLLAKESWHKDRLEQYKTQKQALSRFSLAALILSAPILDVLRRELRRLSPGIKIETEQIAEVLQAEVLKREVIDDEKATVARKLVAKAAAKMLRTSSVEKTEDCAVPEEAGENAAG